GKSSITVVPKKFKITPLVEEQILVAVVVIIGAGRPGRDARARPIDISDSRPLGDLFEQLATTIDIKSVFLADSAVRDIDIRPAVVIKVTDRHRDSMHPLDPWSDVLDLRIKRRCFMNKVDPKGVSGFFEMKAIFPTRIALMNPACYPWDGKH